MPSMTETLDAARSRQLARLPGWPKSAGIEPLICLVFSNAQISDAHAHREALRLHQ